jgi:hypothetical protein
MKTKTKCTIQWDADVDAYIVSTPFSKQFVDFLKLAIPVSDRAWDNDKKVWYIKEAFCPVIRSVAEKVWTASEILFVSKDDVATQQAKKTSVAAVAKAPIEQVLADFVKMLPKTALKTAFRLAAQELHPDKQGGDGQKMASLNALWTRIESDLPALRSSN